MITLFENFRIADVTDKTIYSITDHIKNYVVEITAYLNDPVGCLPQEETTEYDPMHLKITLKFSRDYSKDEVKKYFGICLVRFYAHGFSLTFGPTGDIYNLFNLLGETKYRNSLWKVGSVKSTSIISYDDASNFLKPALARGEICCIGATTVDEYRRYIESDPALERRFEKIMVAEPSPEEDSPTR